MNIFAPNTKILSSQVNQNFTDLSTGAGDVTANNLELARRMTVMSFVYSGMSIATSATLIQTLAAGVAIINGKYVAVVAQSITFTASKDIYVDVKDDGTVVQVAVANGATTGMTLTTNSDGSNALRVAKVVTSATAITGVTQFGVDSLNNYIYNIAPYDAAAAWKNWVPTITGFSALPAGAVYQYKLMGKTCIVAVRMPNTGTSNANFLTITAPFVAATVPNMTWIVPALPISDNGVSIATPGMVTLSTGSNVMNVLKDGSSGVFTTTGGKRANFELIYQID